MSIYLDNAATSVRKPESVIDAIRNTIENYGNPARGVYTESLNSSRLIYEARENIAKFVGCPEVSHVIFTSGATQALNMAIAGIFHKGDHVITTEFEHNSVLRPLNHLKELGIIELDYVKTDSQCNIDFRDFERLIKKNTKAIVCTHASNVTGDILDIGIIGEIAYTHNLCFILDASQTIGVIGIDMVKNHINALCFSGHKGLMAATGTGCLCISDIDVEPIFFGGTGIQSFEPVSLREYPEKLEVGTPNIIGISGLNAAVQYINSVGIERIFCHESRLRSYFIGEMQALGRYRIMQNEALNHTATVAVIPKDTDAAGLASYLSDHGIAIRAGAHCAPLLVNALGQQNNGIARFSFGYMNTQEEIDILIDTLKQVSVN